MLLIINYFDEAIKILTMCPSSLSLTRSPTVAGYIAIPKANSIFTFKVDKYQFSLHGNHMKFKASERSARKFKDKPTIDL